MRGKHLLFIVLFASSAAHATLGETDDSVSKDATALKATGLKQRAASVKASTTSALAESTSCYKATEMNDNGVTVIQYTDTNTNKVFAISYHGIRRANLQQLMGTYFSEYQSAADTSTQSKSARTKLRHPHTVKSSQVTVRAAGRPRAFKGLVTLDSAIPKCVTSVEDLQ